MTDYRYVTDVIVANQKTTKLLTSEQNMTAVYNIFNQRWGTVVEEYHIPGVPFYHIKAFIPLVKSIGLSSALKTCEAFSQFCIDRWGVIEEDPFDCDS
ncbi:elongation factor 2 [Artemisia annua]|uniref:Elongation factor 2 n=1 Tax=Artemisia annua TaxID=35608 RepID=A0A2U1PCZ7_ARTAN|nr:elongation factor 2 [Artemisia annua]